MNRKTEYYRQLQALAKANGIKANQKKKALIKALKAAKVEVPDIEPPESWIARVWQTVWQEIKKYLAEVTLQVFVQDGKVNIKMCYRARCWTLLRVPIEPDEAGKIVEQIRTRDLHALRTNRNIRKRGRLIKVLKNIEA